MLKLTANFNRKQSNKIQMKNQFNYFWLLHLILFVCLSFALSCTRPEKPLKEGFQDRFPQGADDNLIPIDFLRLSSNIEEDNPYSFKSLKDSILKPDSLLKIKTVSKGEKVKISVGQKDTGIDPKVSFRNEYEILNYEIVKPKTKFQEKLKQLLGKVEFHGFPDTEYYIAPHFERNYLMLYKVGRWKDIPYDERHLGVKSGDKVAVPLVGYPIQYCKGEVKLDDYDQESDLSRPVCDGVSIKDANYISLYAANTKEEFKYLSKLDLFPKDFFKGKWFYYRTVVKSPEKREVGHRFFEAAHLVEFHQFPDKLELRDASGYNLEEEDKVRSFFIPIERQDYRIKRKSENIAEDFAEELKDKSPDINRPWFTIKFDDLVKNEIEFEGKKSLKDHYVSNDYVSFDVEVTQKGSGAYLLTYAFRKAVDNPGYIEKQWFEEDSSLFFPVFAEKRKYYKLATDHTQEDNDRFFRTTRFDPKKGEIKWYFSKQTPKEDRVRDIGRQAVTLLNRAFEIASEGSKNKIKITLDKTGADKGVGDIRYNIINLVVSDSVSGGLFGLGPNVANPITGEAISATANVWVSNIVASYINTVRAYIRFQIYPPSWRMWSFPYGVTDFIHERIQKNCPKVREFIQKQQAIQKQQNKRLVFHPEDPRLQDTEIINRCAHKISQIQILETTLHEMLHGVGLRHIFSASADSENFYKSYKEMRELFGEDFGGKVFLEATKSHPHPPQFSSLMDYSNLLSPILFLPGKLDIASLRFVYFNKVELVKKGAEPFLEVPAGADRDPENPQKSILATIKAEQLKREDIKSYRVCGGKKPRPDDPSIGEINPDDPLCFKSDYGATPKEVVENNISFTNTFLMLRRNRYDSEKITTSPALFGYIMAQHLALIYDKWGMSYRDALLSENGRHVSDYNFLDQSDATEYKTLIEKEAQSNPKFKEYYDIREPLFNYIKELAFLPVKHCVYKRADGSYKSVALENIEEKIPNNEYSEESRDEKEKKVEFINCQSPAVTKWATDNEVWDANSKFGTLITEVGFFSKHRKYLLRPVERDEIDEKSVFDNLSPDMVSGEKPLPNGATFWARYITIFAGMVGVEPDFGHWYYKEMSDYIFNGINLNPYIDETNPHYNRNGTVKLDIPRDDRGYPALPRVLSYKIDIQTPFPATTIGIYEGRQFSVDISKQLLLKLSADTNLKQKLLFHFQAQVVSSADLSRYAETWESGNGLYTPFIAQLYREHKDKQNNTEDKISLEKFIQTHSSVLVSPANERLLIPYEKDSFLARLFQKFHEYSKCVNQHKAVSCEDLEEKRIFIKAVLDVYASAG